MKSIGRILICVLMVTMILFVAGCGGNDRVTKIIPQSEKKEYFSNFEEEKRFMLREAFKAVVKAGETPKAYYKDEAHFTKGSMYCAFDGYITCQSGKLALVHVQYDMRDTAALNKKFKNMSNSEIAKVPYGQVSEALMYKSIPNVYASNAMITDNFFER